VRRLLISAALLTLLVGCPKQQPPPQPTEDPVSDRPEVEINRVRPDGTTEGTPVTVTVTGWGFDDGSEVYLASRKARGVDVIDDGELTFRATEDLRAGVYDVRVVTPDGDQAVATRAFTVEERAGSGDCVLRTVYFEFNEFKLTADARQALSDNAACIDAGGLTAVRLEGHADERGSTEYNLSLGQRRAESVKTYLGNLGVSDGVLRTVSYGEEAPAESGWGEQAWSRNRRVEFVVP